MDEQETLDRIRKQLAVKETELLKLYGKKLEAISSKHASRGFSRPTGMYFSEQREAYFEYLDQLTQDLWDIFIQSFGTITIRLDDHLNDLLIAEIDALWTRKKFGIMYESDDIPAMAKNAAVTEYDNYKIYIIDKYRLKISEELQMSKYDKVRFEILRLLWNIKTGKELEIKEESAGVNGFTIFTHLGEGLSCQEFAAQLDYMEEKHIISKLPKGRFDVITPEDGLKISFYRITSYGIELLEGKQNDPGIPNIHHYYNIHSSGISSRVNISSEDKSINIFNMPSKSIFQDMRNAIQENVKIENEREQIISKISELENEKEGSEGFKFKYAELIQLTANYTTILGPFLPALTKMLLGS
ncbi:MAG: hypothetical protein WB930_09235 [Syntrophobacteraceae bacterium]